MSILSGKNILLGVTAGIAAYKTAQLTRSFIKAGANVKVIMTPKSKEFITPLTLSTLSQNPVYSEFVNTDEHNELWNSHVDFGLWADYMLIAPATANTMSKMVKGTADNLLVATYLSAKCPVFVAPAMDLDMYKHPSTKNSLQQLEAFGNFIIPAEIGELASGLEGEGRMAEPENIIAFIENQVLQSMPLYGKRILITAGPTYEAIDPVRFIGNHSSGKMGFELAKQASRLGAQVTLITGPTAQNCEGLPINRLDITSAQQMFEAVFEYYKKSDIVIAAAAVADYKPVEIALQKIKKENAKLEIALTPTKDILAEMGRQKINQTLIGFALETENELANAKGKLNRKNLDFIVLNSLQDKGAGFKKNTNKVTIIDKFNKISEFSLKSKAEVAIDIFNTIIPSINE